MGRPMGRFILPEAGFPNIGLPREGPGMGYLGPYLGPLPEGLMNSILKESLENRHQTHGLPAQTRLRIGPK